MLPQQEMVWDGTNIEMSGFTVPFKLFAKLGIKVNYQGTTETVANITDNSLHVIGFTTAIAMGPAISYNARLRFVG